MVPLWFICMLGGQVLCQRADWEMPPLQTITFSAAGQHLLDVVCFVANSRTLPVHSTVADVDSTALSTTVATSTVSAFATTAVVGGNDSAELGESELFESYVGDFLSGKSNFSNGSNNTTTTGQEMEDVPNIYMAATKFPAGFILVDSGKEMDYHVISVPVAFPLVMFYDGG